MVVEVEKSRRKPTTSDNKKEKRREMDDHERVYVWQLIFNGRWATRDRTRRQKRKPTRSRRRRRKTAYTHTLTLLKSLWRNDARASWMMNKKTVREERTGAREKDLEYLHMAQTREIFICFFIILCSIVYMTRSISSRCSGRLLTMKPSCLTSIFCPFIFFAFFFCPLLDASWKPSSPALPEFELDDVGAMANAFKRSLSNSG